jgi:hypothetical protein
MAGTSRKKSRIVSEHAGNDRQLNSSKQTGRETSKTKN